MKKIFFALITFTVVAGAGCQTPSKPVAATTPNTAVDCMSYQQKFDEYVKKSKLPILENQDSLCHGLNVGSNFKNMQPKWAVAELAGLQTGDFCQLIFRGINTEGTVFYPLSTDCTNKYVIGKKYKIDMNDFCRLFMMLADSRLPSPIATTLTKPTEITCLDDSNTTLDLQKYTTKNFSVQFPSSFTAEEIKDGLVIKNPKGKIMIGGFVPSVGMPLDKQFGQAKIIMYSKDKADGGIPAALFYAFGDEIIKNQLIGILKTIR